MEKSIILISQEQYDKLWDMLSGSAIADGYGTCKMLHHQRHDYIVTGGTSEPGKGRHSYNGYRVVDLSTYKGKLHPLPYNEHFADAALGNRPRAYTGMRFKSGKRHMVVMEPVEFQPGHEVKQLSIF